MTQEELIRRIRELEQENGLLRSRLREIETNRTVSYDDLKNEYDVELEENENINDESYITSPVIIDASKSANSSVSETKDDKKENRSGLRSRLFPWLNKKSISKISDEQEDLDYQIANDDEELVDINQFATTDKKGSNNQSDDTVTEDKPLDLSDFSFVDINEEENENQEENENENENNPIEDENVNDDAKNEDKPLDLSDFSFVDINEEENENQEENENENENDDDFFGYYFDDDEVAENEDNNKKRRFPFFRKREEKIDYQPKHLRKTKKLERIRESKFFKKIKSALNNKAVKVIAAVLIAPVAIGGIILAAKLSNDEKNNNHDNTSNVLYDNSDIPSTTAANEFGVSAKDVVSSVDKKDDNSDKKDDNSDKKEKSTNDSKEVKTDDKLNDESNQEDYEEKDETIQSSNDEVVINNEYESNEEDIQENNEPQSTSDEVADSYEHENNQEDIQENEVLKATDDEAVINDEYENDREDIQENDGPKSTSDEVVDNDLSDYTIVDDGYSVEIGYDIGDSVNFDGPYIYRTSIDAKNDTNRYNPLYPSTDKRVISLIRFVSPDGSEKITIDANNKDKKEQLEAQGWTIESYNIDNLTNGVTNEGWTPGKSLK